MELRRKIDDAGPSCGQSGRRRVEGWMRETLGLCLCRVAGKAGGKKQRVMMKAVVCGHARGE
jgi:hypothetical protein